MVSALCSACPHTGVQMKQIRLVSRLCSILACSCLPSVAFAQAEKLTDKGTSANVNQERPNLPAVAANTAAGRFGDKSQLTISSDAGLSIASTSVSDVDGSTTT